MSPVALARPPWKLRSPDPELVAGLSRAHGISQVASSLLVTRGITDPALAGGHLEPRLSALHDPALLPGMAAATERIARAIEMRETILVHGDYDVDAQRHAGGEGVLGGRNVDRAKIEEKIGRVLLLPGRAVSAAAASPPSSLIAA